MSVAMIMNVEAARRNLWRIVRMWKKRSQGSAREKLPHSKTNLEVRAANHDGLLVLGGSAAQRDYLLHLYPCAPHMN